MLLKRLHGATVVCNVAEVELALTLAALPAILRAEILGVDTRCNWRVACNIARNVAPCVTALGPFTHAIFDAISDAISRTKRGLFREASCGLERKVSHII